MCLNPSPSLRKNHASALASLGSALLLGCCRKALSGPWPTPLCASQRKDKGDDTNTSIALLVLPDNLWVTIRV